MPNKPALPSLGYIADTMRSSQPGRALDGARSLPLGLIDPNPAQARQVFDPQALDELAQSIAQHGVLEPILVRPAGDRYTVIAGERRLRAAQAAGLEAIPAIIRADLSDQDAGYITAVENLQRQDLSIEDEARQFATLLEVTGLSQRELAKKLGIGFNYLSRRVRLLTRGELLAAISAGDLTLHQALEYVSTGAPYPPPVEVYPGDTRDTAIAETNPEQLSEGWAIDPPMDSPNEPEQLPRPATNRAALNKQDGAPARPVSWRLSVLADTVTFLERLDRRTIPLDEQPAARDLAAMLERQAAELRAALSED